MKRYIRSTTFNDMYQLTIVAAVDEFDENVADDMYSIITDSVSDFVENDTEDIHITIYDDINQNYIDMNPDEVAVAICIDMPKYLEEDRFEIADSICDNLDINDYRPLDTSVA